LGASYSVGRRECDLHRESVGEAYAVHIETSRYVVIIDVLSVVKVFAPGNS